MTAAPARVPLLEIAPLGIGLAAVVAATALGWNGGVLGTPPALR